MMMISVLKHICKQSAGNCITHWPICYHSNWVSHFRRSYFAHVVTEAMTSYEESLYRTRDSNSGINERKYSYGTNWKQQIPLVTSSTEALEKV